MLGEYHLSPLYRQSDGYSKKSSKTEKNHHNYDVQKHIHLGHMWLVRPILQYSNPVWGPQSILDQRKLENRAICLLSSLSEGMHLYVCLWVCVCVRTCVCVCDSHFLKDFVKQNYKQNWRGKRQGQIWRNKGAFFHTIVHAMHSSRSSFVSHSSLLTIKSVNFVMASWKHWSSLSVQFNFIMSLYLCLCKDICPCPLKIKLTSWFAYIYQLYLHKTCVLEKWCLQYISDNTGKSRRLQGHTEGGFYWLIAKHLGTR